MTGRAPPSWLGEFQAAFGDVLQAPLERASGTLRARTEAYPEALAMIRDGRVALEPFVEVRSMGEVNAVLDDMRGHRLTRRVVLDPRV